MDQFGRLQPLLGTAEPATDHLINPINYPNTPLYVNAGLIGQMEGAMPWHAPTTEKPALGSTEIWGIYNSTGDGHPVHLHLISFCRKSPYLSLFKIKIFIATLGIL